MKKATLFFFIFISFFDMLRAQSILGIDVSAVQQVIDWNQVSSSGKTFAFVKSTKGVCYTDSKFFTNMSNGSSAGLKMGAYHFALPEDNSASSEANYFLSVAGSYIGNGYLPPVLDIEDPDGTCLINSQPLTNFYTSGALTSWVQTWVTTVQNATGVAPIIYTSSNIASYLNASLNGYRLWIANPATSPTTPPANIGNWTTWAFKQYSWVGSVSGISGNVDLDVFNGTISDFNSLLGIGGQPDLTPSSQSLSITTVAAGSSVIAYCAESNSGNTTSTPNVVNIYLSPDAVLTPGSNGDVYIDYINFSSVSASSTSSINSKSIQIPSGTLNGNYYLFYWVDGGQIVSESNETNNFATSQITVTPSNQTYSINASANPVIGGSTSGSGNYPLGQQVTVIANSNSGYSFINWTESGSPVTSNVSYTFSATTSRSLIANFSSCVYSLNNYSTNLTATGSSSAFWVNTTSDCNWTATTSGCSGMITLTSASGTGSGIVAFNISSNLSASSRSCTINVQGITFTVNQVGYVAPCINPPANPSNCTASINGSNSISVTWFSGGWANLTEYEVERSMSSLGPFSTIAFITDSSTNFLDSSVVAGVTYYYRVRACCNSNCSNYTNVANAQACVYSTATSSILVSNTNLCAGDSVTLTVNGGILGTGASWIWRANQCNSGTVVGTGNSITLAPTVNTTYVVKAEGGCSYGFTPCSVIPLSINAMPIASTISSSTATTFCANDSVTLMGNNGGLWNNGLSTSSITVYTSGDYFVTNSNLCGNVTSNHILVIANLLPVVTIYSSSINVCNGDSVIMSGGGAETYIWANGIVNGLAFLPTSSATYTVTGTDTNGCSNTTTNSIIVNQLPTVTASASDTVLCMGSSLTLTGGGANTYTWTDGVINAIPFVANASNIYTVIGTDSNGCTNSASKTIVVNSLPVANAGNDISIFQGDATVIGGSPTASGNGPFTYSWSPLINLDSANVANPTASPQDTTTYFVIITDVNGCSSSDSVLIFVPLGNGVFESANEYLFSVFPNPASSQLNIKGSKINNGEYSIELKNFVGQTIYKNKMNVVNHSIETQFLLSQIADGIYFLIIESENIRSVTKVQKVNN